MERASRELVALLQRRVHLLVTEHLMTLELPGARLRLGQDLRAAFPPSLAQLTEPELRALLARLDPTPDSLHGSGAADWADLPDRLHFIADLFRCCQESPALLQPPFTPEQAAAIAGGGDPGSGGRGTATPGRATASAPGVKAG